jgi:DNA-binding MarR family transcriptional regulator
MDGVEPTDLDLPTLATLSGGGTSRLLLDRLAAAGYPGIRLSHGYVFQRLVAGEPTISALAASLGITQQGASKQVSELEAGGYVERVGVAGDQRVRVVRVTAKGRAAMAAGRRLQAELEAEIAERLGEEKVTAAKEVLAALLTMAGLDERVRTRTVPAPG